ncbi:hypothetical protein J2S19_000430 [Metabacillus malikii]|uniref:Uncharacterized protein n=2 Tax=Metabacillus malikii TaxID=1504265 RepID=A0ABT9ZA96_9BACI|nr:hypothetical protein [Metabacillus malikii]
MQKLNWLFQTLIVTGGVAYTLAFFEIGSEFFDRYYSWFLIFLWVGIVGNFILKWYEKKQGK